MKQLSFLPKINLTHSAAHGGDTRLGKRKTARPFDPKRPIHIVLRSERARGKWSMLRHREQIERLLQSVSAKYGVRVHRFANVGNHLHLLISLTPASTQNNSKSPNIGETPFERARALVSAPSSGSSRESSPSRSPARPNPTRSDASGTGSRSHAFFTGAANSTA